ncbi:MAG: DUF1566 domain-containing protein [Marinagarivorans sp.]|nr:DUF1566 domain-containing protein [Marinagarivorans sp.]
MTKPHYLLAAVLVLCGYSYSNTGHTECLDNLPHTVPNHRFTIAEGTVTDHKTGLMWLRCTLGQRWNISNQQCELNSQQARTYHWSEALMAANNLTEAGFNDWRLPNKNELASIIEHACTGPAINEAVFPSTALDGFWSSTPGRRDPGLAWHVNFATGTLINREMSALFSVRVVRSPE